MKLTILVDNNTLIDQYYLAEPALSFLIEDENKQILFDCGYSDVFLKNAEKLGIDLINLDVIIFSHNHNDHTRGINNLINIYEKSKNSPCLIAHPTIFRQTTLAGIGNIGINLPRSELENYFNVHLRKEPVNITKHLFYLGEIPRSNDFEGNVSIGINENTGKADFMSDDTALVYKTEEGLIIITACSHSGICNICDYAKIVCDDKRIVDIIGGLHLLNPKKKQMNGTLEYIKNLNLKSLYACHCTDLNSKVKLAGVVSVKEVGSGIVLEF